MSSFHFRLQSVLELRQRQLDAEEAAYKRATAALAELDRMRGALEAAATNAEMQVRRSATVTGSELAALGAYRVAVKAQQAELAKQRAQQALLVAERQSAMLEARRRMRLLERLKERRKAEWAGAEAKALEELAAEAYIAQWNLRKT